MPSLTIFARKQGPDLGELELATDHRSPASEAVLWLDAVLWKELPRLVPQKLWPPAISVEHDFIVLRIQMIILLSSTGLWKKVERNDPDVVLDLFWRTSFSYTPIPFACNWKRGVLVDLSDVVHPHGRLLLGTPL